MEIQTQPFSQQLTGVETLLSIEPNNESKPNVRHGQASDPSQPLRQRQPRKATKTSINNHDTRNNHLRTKSCPCRLYEPEKYQVEREIVADFEAKQSFKENDIETSDFNRKEIMKYLTDRREMFQLKEAMRVRLYSDISK